MKVYLTVENKKIHTRWKKTPKYVDLKKDDASVIDLSFKILFSKAFHDGAISFY